MFGKANERKKCYSSGRRTSERTSVLHRSLYSNILWYYVTDRMLKTIQYLENKQMSCLSISYATNKVDAAMDRARL
jgi:hypothetical protein